MPITSMPSRAEPLPDDAETDAALVRAALGGDRDAFGHLVERHQAAVCAITCSGTGDQDRGLDLAQETFLQAWRSLPALRDATRVRPWLCGIARTLLSNAARHRQRSSTTSLDDVREPVSPGPLPHDEAAAREEQAMVWRALEAVPAPYREALVLFYWEDHSVARVADLLGLGEEAVRQRLARGRRMVRAQVVTLVATGLRRARPGKAFTVAVVAALPAGVPGAAAAAAGMGATAAKAATLGVGVGGAVVGSTVGLVGGALGAWASIRNTRSPRERRFMVRMTGLFALASLAGMALMVALVTLLHTGGMSRRWWLAALAALVAAESTLVVWAIVRTNRRQREIQRQDGTHVPTGPRSDRERRFLVVAGMLSLAYVGACFVLAAAFEHYYPARAESVFGQLTMWSLYLVGLMQGVAWINRRQHAIRVAEGRALDLPLPPPDGPTREIGASPRVIYGSLAGGVFGGTLWMFPMCWMAGDWWLALAILAVALTTLHVCARAAIRRPERYFRIAFWEGVVTGGLVLLVLNLRYQAWMVFYRQSRWYDPAGDWPLWLVNVAVVTLFVWLQLDMLRRDRRHRRRWS